MTLLVWITFLLIGGLLAIGIAFGIAEFCVGSILAFISKLVEPRQRTNGRDISRYSAILDLPAMVGTIGTAQTPFRPSGFVVLDGKRHEAITEGEFLESGVAVKIVKTNGNNLVVRRI